MSESKKKYLRRPVLTIIGMVCLAVSVAAQDPSPPNSEAMVYVQEGRELYLKGLFKPAIASFEKALALEKKRPTLEKAWWRYLVEDLAISYALSGDLKKAKETFEYGLARDPKYWSFNYNMACTYAEMNDVDKAISYLKLAYKYAEEMTDKPKFDPWTDSSFKKLMNDDKFFDALTELERKRAGKK